MKKYEITFEPSIGRENLFVLADSIDFQQGFIWFFDHGHDDEVVYIVNADFVLSIEKYEVES